MFSLQLQSRLAYLESAAKAHTASSISNLVDNETKKATTTTMLKYPEADFRIGEPELQKYMKIELCKDSSI